jgi:hypothetical protein
MPTFPRPRRPAREPDEPLLDMILDGRSLPPDAPRDAHALADRLTDLAGPAEPGVLPGEAAARSAFARTALRAGVSRRPDRRRPRLPARRAALAAALVAVTAGLGSAVAAYAGALPGPIQDFAHHVIGAPPAHWADLLKPQPSMGRPGNGTAGRQKTHAATPGEGHATAPGTATPGEGHATAPGTATPGEGHPTAPTGTATTTPCPHGTKANFRWHYTANGNAGGWSGTATKTCPGSVSMGPQAMGGNLQVTPGATLKAGYDFTLPGNSKSLTMTASAAKVTLAVSCVSGAAPSASTLTVTMPAQTYQITNDQWYPSGDQSSPLVYQGSATVPDLCGGGKVDLAKGGTFSATLS